MNEVFSSFYCSSNGNSQTTSLAIKDVTASTLTNNNKLILPCQSCAVINQTANFVYDGFLLLIYYDNNVMPVINTAIFLNSQNYSPFMTYNLNGLNKIINSNDVGLSIWANDLNMEYPISFTLNSFSNFVLGSLWFNEGLFTDESKVPGSFYYENNTLTGLVDDSPNAFIDSSDALANIKSYINNNITSVNLSATLGTDPACYDVINTFILAYSTPCPARNLKPLQTYTLCNGQGLQLNATPGASHYSWYPGSSLNNDTLGSPVASPTIGLTNYIVQVDSFGCKHTEYFTVTTFPSPKFDSVTVYGAVCGVNAGAAIINNAHDGTLPLSLDIGGAAQTNNSFYPLTPNSYTATVTDSKGCKYKKPFTVSQINQANVSFNFSHDTVCLGYITTFANTSVGVNNLNWYIDNTLFSSVFGNANYLFNDTLSHIVTLIGWSNIPQCSDTITKTIYVKECPPDSFSITVPNVFTPNADGINDTWQPLIYEYGYTIENFVINIFDRWGLKVFESSYAQKSWDGRTTSGSACSEGTYYYVINYTANSFAGKTKKETLKGFLQLSR
ncbi:MAG TPA: gliding motility-associated C-terminal domain-containing protein [Bacteroidia bacterium]|nr:gliding motility-associated C-terminal domain-containing protein [Bacteroidia bacterium]